MNNRFKRTNELVLLCDLPFNSCFSITGNSDIVRKGIQQKIDNNTYKYNLENLTTGQYVYEAPFKDTSMVYKIIDESINADLPERTPTAIERHADNNSSINVYRLKLKFKTMDVINSRNMDNKVFRFETDSLHSALLVLESLHMLIDSCTGSFGNSSIRFASLQSIYEHAAILTSQGNGDFSYCPYVKPYLVEFQRNVDTIKGKNDIF